MNRVIYTRERFDLNDQNMADLFKVSQDEINEWLRYDNMPTNEEIGHISNVHRIVKELDSYSVTKLKSSIHEPLFDNRSFLDLLACSYRIVSDDDINVLKNFMNDKEN